MESYFFDCQCSDFGHTIRFLVDPDDGEVHLEVHLRNWLPWYRRLWAAVLYVLKRHRPYGHYDCTLLRFEDLDRLKTLVELAQLRATSRQQATLKSPPEKPLLKD